MTKNEQSDLKSLVGRLVETEKNLIHAQLARGEAERQLDMYVHKLVHSPQVNKEDVVNKMIRENLDHFVKEG